ncbi:MAG: redoxin domain-containing protein [Ferruginibacter sp.]
MKKYLLLMLCSIGFLATQAQGYHINLQSNYKAGIVYLTYYMGKDFILQDSAAVSSTGLAVFKDAKKLQPGIYVIVFPGKRLTADFLIEKEQTLSINADTNHLEQIRITGSQANIIFKQYQNFVNVKGKQLQDVRVAYNAAKAHEDSVKYETAYKKYSKELNDYRTDIVTKNPTSMMAVLLTALREPPYPKTVAITHEDSVANYNFYKQHYWDGISFMDERIIRTPFFLPKLETYYREVMPQSSDSLIKDIDYKLLLARSNTEMYKFLLNWFTDEYISPKYMGQDAVFVHLYEQYHSKGITTWLNEKQHEAITRRAFMVMANLIGEKAADMQFVDTAGIQTSLYNVDAPYTVVVFWDPSCGHCKQELPRIDSIYRANWQKKNVKIYAVLSESEKMKPEWLSYIREHNIGHWINVYQTKSSLDLETKEQRPSYRQLYDVVLTPTLYLLDKDKRIVAKKLTLEQINDLLEVKIKKG